MNAEASASGAPAISSHQPVRPGIQPRSKLFGLLAQIVQCLLLLILVAVSYLLIAHFLVGSVTVMGNSMAPTLHDSDRYLLNRWVLHLREPRREDIVVLQDPVDRSFAVKRVIGVAGDQVCLKGGEVYVNGRKLDESYLSPGTPTFPWAQCKEQTIPCGKGEFFVLGDNRKNSVDSRAYGPVPRANILGLIVR